MWGALHGLLPPWKRLWDLSTHPVPCLSILLPLLLPCHLLSYGPTIWQTPPLLMTIR